MMKNEHILNLLDERPLASLSDGERAGIEAHAAVCSECLRAYKAAAVASALIQARAGETVEPPPFFKTRVMAALRERLAEQPFTFAAMWRTARAMVASMITVIVVLLALNFYLGGSGVTGGPEEMAAGDTLYSAESVIWGNSDSADELTDSQVLTTLYEPSRSYGEYK